MAQIPSSRCWQFTPTPVLENPYSFLQAPKWDYVQHISAQPATTGWSPEELRWADRPGPQQQQGGQQRLPAVAPAAATDQATATPTAPLHAAANQPAISAFSSPAPTNLARWHFTPTPHLEYPACPGSRPLYIQHISAQSAATYWSPEELRWADRQATQQQQGGQQLPPAVAPAAATTQVTATPTAPLHAAANCAEAPTAASSAPTIPAQAPTSASTSAVLQVHVQPGSQVSLQLPPGTAMTVQVAAPAGVPLTVSVCPPAGSSEGGISIHVSAPAAPFEAAPTAAAAAAAAAEAAPTAAPTAAAPPAAATAAPPAPPAAEAAAPAPAPASAAVQAALPTAPAPCPPPQHIHQQWAMPAFFATVAAAPSTHFWKFAPTPMLDTRAGTVHGSNCFHMQHICAQEAFTGWSAEELRWADGQAQQQQQAQQPQQQQPQFRQPLPAAAAPAAAGAAGEGAGRGGGDGGGSIPGGLAAQGPGAAPALCDAPGGRQAAAPSTEPHPDTRAVAPDELRLRDANWQSAELPPDWWLEVVRTGGEVVHRVQMGSGVAAASLRLCRADAALVLRPPTSSSTGRGNSRGSAGVWRIGRGKRFRQLALMLSRATMENVSRCRLWSRQGAGLLRRQLRLGAAMALKAACGAVTAQGGNSGGGQPKPGRAAFTFRTFVGSSSSGDSSSEESEAGESDGSSGSSGSGTTQPARTAATSAAQALRPLRAASPGAFPTLPPQDLPLNATGSRAEAGGSPPRVAGDGGTALARLHQLQMEAKAVLGTTADV